MPAGVGAANRLRAPDQVMTLERMGAAFPTRLSFMRILLRRLDAEKARVTRPVWEIDDSGFGRAVYSATLSGHTYSLVAFATPLADDKRTDRVIAEAWDASFALFDGVPTRDDLDRLEANAPKQEVGRFEPSELVLSRANKSVRLFEHVVERLASGRQPDGDMIASVGYLMRTTAVYGNGKFGIADRVVLENRPGLDGPFQAEMLTVWLIRGFTHDLADHIAKARNPVGAVRLSAATRRNLGIGNATGLGMAPFLVNHPLLLNNWVRARETALARVRAVEHADEGTNAQVRELIARAARHVRQWKTDDARQKARIATLRRELEDVRALATEDWLSRPFPWDRMMKAAQVWSVETRELVAALLLEPHGALVDDLADDMADRVGLALDPAMTTGELLALLREGYQWALDLDSDAPDSTALFWYVSEEKLEPRLGWRREEPGADREMPLDIARQAQALHADLCATGPARSLAGFLLEHPQHRYLVRRVQASAESPYLEIRDNLINAACIPLDILRFKLSFFGAAKCDPKSDRWTRINMYQGAPLFEDIGKTDCDDWWLPVLEDG